MTHNYGHKDYWRENWKRSFANWGVVARVITLLLYSAFIIAAFTVLPNGVPRLIELGLRIIVVAWLPVLVLILTPARMWIDAQNELDRSKDTAKETSGPMAVMPFIGRRAGLNDQIQFELTNEGTSDIELIQFKVMIPDRILDTAWPRHGIPPISSMEQSVHNGESHTAATYFVTDSPIALGYSPDSQRLPRYLAGKATAILRDFRFPLIRDVAERHKTAVIRYELALRGVPVIRGEITLGELLERPARDF